MTLRTRFALVCLLAGLTVSAGCSGSAVIATVDGDAISKVSLDERLEASPQGVAVLRELVVARLIERYAKAHDISASDAQIAKREAEIRANKSVSEWANYLSSLGMNESDARKALAQRIIIEAALSKKVSITSAQVESYFARNRAQFDTPDQIRVRHILVADRKTADKIEALLKSGRTFAALAQQYSIDPGSRNTGGEIGFVARGAMLAPFEKVAYSQPVGAISAPVKTAYGYHIIQVEERHMGVKATLVNTHDRIVDTLREQQEAPLIPLWISDLESKAKITVEDSRFQSAFPRL